MAGEAQAAGEQEEEAEEGPEQVAGRAVGEVRVVPELEGERAVRAAPVQGVGEVHREQEAGDGQWHRLIETTPTIH